MKPSKQRTAAFGAPLGIGVILITSFSFLLTLAMAVVFPLVMPKEAFWLILTGPAVLAIVIAVTALFCVRGYGLENGQLWIQRLFWRTRFPLDGLRQAYADPKAMRYSLRSAGNGGLFAYSGYFRNKKLGRYRAWVTNTNYCVVLKFDDRTWVISPDNPRQFVRRLGLDSADAK